MLFDTKSQLLRALDSVATYNDKGIAWSRHEPAQVQAERAAYVAKVEKLVATMGESSLPTEFIQALRSGAVALDSTGQFQVTVRRHVSG